MPTFQRLKGRAGSSKSLITSLILRLSSDPTLNHLISMNSDWIQELVMNNKGHSYAGSSKDLEALCQELGTKTKYLSYCATIPYNVTVNWGKRELCLLDNTLVDCGMELWSHRVCSYLTFSCKSSFTELLPSFWKWNFCAVPALFLMSIYNKCDLGFAFTSMISLHLTHSHTIRCLPYNIRV